MNNSIKNITKEVEDDLKQLSILEKTSDNPFFKIISKNQKSHQKKHFKIKSVEIQENENSIFYQLRRDIKFSKLEIQRQIKKTKDRIINQLLQSKY